MKTDPPNPIVPPQIGLLLGISAASTAAIFIRYAQESAPSLVIAAYRLVIASALLAPFILIRYRQELQRLSRWQLSLALLSGLFLALHFATWITSLQYTTVASSVVLVTTTPLWVALLAPFTIREPLTRPIAIGMLVALAGTVIIGLSDACTLASSGLICPSLENLLQGQALFGDLLAVAGAMMAAAYLLIGRSLRSRMSLMAYVFVVYGMAALALCAFVLVARQPFGGYPSQTYLWFILLALVPQLLGHSTFNWALGYVSAALVSVTLLGEPIGSTVLAYIFLHETPTWLKAIGAILILLGIYVASRNSEQSVPLPVD